LSSCFGAVECLWNRVLGTQELREWVGGVGLRVKKEVSRQRLALGYNPHVLKS